MNKLMLSSPAQRAACLAGDLCIAALACVWLALAPAPAAVLAGAAAALLMGTYTYLVFSTAVRLRPEAHMIDLTGLQRRSDDLSAARTVFTRSARVGGLTTRVIVVEDGQGRELSVIQTLFTTRQGYGCEPLARRLAEGMGLAFRATVPVRLYDRKAAREARGRGEEDRRAAPPVNYDEQDGE